MRGFRLVRASEVDADNPVEHDLYLAAGDLDSVAEDAATVQEIGTALLFFLGESFTDVREGLPWYQEILIKGPDPGRVKSIIRQPIAAHPAIADVPTVDYTLDPVTREATITWIARTTQGGLIRSEDFDPLIVGG